ncbi:MAG: hypothetical protein ABSG63_18465 [Spirochaetia bacterium]|jgi:hypothetical protein
MSKNAKLVLFFLGATVFNIVLMVGTIALFILIIGLTVGRSGNATLFQVLIFVGFIVSIVLTFFIYGKVMKWVTVKFQLEKNIPQLFKKKR